jgi:hypothetical protein
MPMTCASCGTEITDATEPHCTPEIRAALAFGRKVQARIMTLCQNTMDGLEDERWPMERAAIKMIHDEVFAIDLRALLEETDEEPPKG